MSWLNLQKPETFPTWGEIWQTHKIETVFTTKPKQELEKDIYFEQGQLWKTDKKLYQKLWYEKNKKKLLEDKAFVYRTKKLKHG